MEWQPIDTAPEHENILVWCEKYEEPVVAFKSDRGSFIGFKGEDLGRICRLTLWMPLPKPPSAYS